MGWQSGELICQCPPNILQISRQWGRAGWSERDSTSLRTCQMFGGLVSNIDLVIFWKSPDLACTTSLIAKSQAQKSAKMEGEDALAMHQQRSPLLQPTSLPTTKGAKAEQNCLISRLGPMRISKEHRGLFLLLHSARMEKIHGLKQEGASLMLFTLCLWPVSWATWKVAKSSKAGWHSSAIEVKSLIYYPFIQESDWWLLGRSLEALLHLASLTCSTVIL